MAPEVGFEPTTNRLTADRSTTELLWIIAREGGVYFAHARFGGKCSFRARGNEARWQPVRELVAGAGFEPAAFRL